ncbi:MAG TPA: ankyrin repeat domain-containing protein [Bacteroidales bacterium]|nr:ankyrin repeat domain-containing protein [Bacteroidales bacterium]
MKPLIPILVLSLSFLISCKNRAPITTPGNEIPEQFSPSAENQASPSVQDTDQALRDAAFEGNLQAVKQLLSGKADVTSTDEDGRTALMLASYNGYTDIAKLLVTSGSRVNELDKEGRNALMYASTGNFPETVSLLLNNGAKINIADTKEHFTALMFAASEGQAKVAEILLQHGADPSMKDVDGDTALSFARQNKHEEVAKLLESWHK